MKKSICSNCLEHSSKDSHHLRTKIILALSIVHVVVVTYVLLVVLIFQQTHNDTKTTIIDNSPSQLQKSRPSSSRASTVESTVERNDGDAVMEISAIEVIPMGSREKNQKMKHIHNHNHNHNHEKGPVDNVISRFNPPGNIKADSVIQIHLDNDGGVDSNDHRHRQSLVVVVGGYTHDYTDVSKWIHFFNVSSQIWMVNASIPLPDHIAETHQGITYDKDGHVLYILSGQKGGGCQKPTTSCTRLWIHTGRFEDLPPLPEARYSPAVELVFNNNNNNSNNNKKKYLHVFGGASPNRMDGMTNHWRLDLDTLSSSNTSSSSPSSSLLLWESLESLPDAGIHGISFLSPTRGYIYYTAYCTMDQMVYQSSSKINDCHKHATKKGQLLNHVSDVGSTYRYPIFPEKKDTRRHQGWERVQDMPFPTCHGGSVAVNDRLVLVGGGLATYQSKQGSAPRPLPFIQIFDAKSETWQVYPFRLPKKRTHLFLLTTWFDEERDTFFSLHPGNVLLTAAAKHSGVSSNITGSGNSTVIKPMRIDEFFLRQTRHVNIVAFQRCLSSNSNDNDHPERVSMGDTWRNTTTTNIPIYTVLDANNSMYESARRTWNERNVDRQYPDIIVFPADNIDVSSIVKCSRRTGYRLCARNGKHSYDGSSVCSRSIVVDVSRLKEWTVINMPSNGTVSTRTMARFGAGFTLGQVADVLYLHGMALPMGSCASVGVTGLTLSGGQGPLARSNGLTCDHLDSIELVDSSGSILNAFETNSLSDLLWLARGGGAVGPHFPGIITALTFTNLVQVGRPNQNATRNFGNEGDDYIDDTVKTTSRWTRVKIRYPATIQSATDLLVSWHNFLIYLASHEDRRKRIRRSDAQLDEQRDLVHDPAWYDHDRRLTIEPWIVISPKKLRRHHPMTRAFNHSAAVTNEVSTTLHGWERSLFLNVYFFGNETLHSEVFLRHILPMLKDWTSTKVTGGGRVTKMERLDHFAFQCKLGGVRNRDELISGYHGHDTGHVRWKGYSYVLPSTTISRAPYSFQSILRTAVKNFVREVWYDAPFTKRYVEFKPLGGAIQDFDSQVGGAFPHRKSLWLMLVNHFLPQQLQPTMPDSITKPLSFSPRAADPMEKLEEGNILATAHRSYSQFARTLDAAINVTNHFSASMYSGYVDHDDTFSGQEAIGSLEILERYYGKDISLRIMKIVHKYDPHNIFRRTLPFPRAKEKYREQS